MKILTVIPVRYGSTRFPGKPLALINGKPMIQHVYERVMQWKACLGVYVATDDERIAQIVREFGGNCIFSQGDYATGTDRVADVVKKSMHLVNEPCIIVNVQGDEPLITTDVLDELVEPFRRLKTMQVTTLAHRITTKKEMRDKNIVKVVFDCYGNALYFSRSPIPHDAPNGYRHVGVYAFDPTLLLHFPRLPRFKAEGYEKLEQLRLLENGYKIGVVCTEYEGIGVDVPEDIQKVEKLVSVSGYSPCL